MQLIYIKWRDAMIEDGADDHQVTTELLTLQEVGWLLSENEEAITIGMEVDGEDYPTPGRWRLNIPRVNILETRIMDWGKAFPKRSIV